jgi:Dr1-associated corepressor
MKAEAEDDEYLPDVKEEEKPFSLSALPPANGSQYAFGMPPQPQAQGIGAPQFQDPTLGVQLKTSFPVARIKRIMQADDDIGKVAQVTPHVVSRALELFMIKIISASAAQAAQAGGGGSGKGPKRILAQHVKKALQADVNFDFLEEIIAKVPDAPVKAKKEQAGSDSDDGETMSKPVKRRGKKRKDSADD